MFKKLMILSFIFIVGACQTKFEKSEIKKKKSPDTKVNMFGDLQKTWVLLVLWCKKNGRDCSLSSG